MDDGDEGMEVRRFTALLVMVKECTMAVVVILDTSRRSKSARTELKNGASKKVGDNWLETQPVYGVVVWVLHMQPHCTFPRHALSL